MFKKVLIANRGEIAVRIMRACREMGIRSVAVFSEADRQALHVRYASEALCIGPPPVRESYLNIEAIIEAARRSGAEAVHPGYGFLAENPEFPRACNDAGLTFIGPSAEAIAAMGEKTGARARMKAAGVPVVPGGERPLKDEAEALATAAEIGYPVMLKAAAGGGGRGMRLVANEKKLKKTFTSAGREAKMAFGDDAIYIEKAIEQPHHVEIQVLCDSHGSAVYLGERECSVQRRHQKVVEETPSPVVDGEMRRQMGESAVKAALAVDYVGAGTVEFLVDARREFYFLEMNTRIQVEHPVTELCTGVDLVHQQIAIAAGERLGLTQDDIRPRGHAIECRIYAENPAKQFLPSPGTITYLREPSGPDVRVDSGVYSGFTVPIYYDSLLAKLCTWGADREQAIARMKRALHEYLLKGVVTNIPFLRQVMCHPAFAEGRYDTGFIEKHLKELISPEEVFEEVAVVAAIIAAHQREEQLLAGRAVTTESSGKSAWKLAGRRRAMTRGWR